MHSNLPGEHQFVRSDAAEPAGVGKHAVVGAGGEIAHRIQVGRRDVNAAFVHAHPLGSRFADADRGAWDAGDAVETAQAEVAFHKTVEYAEIDRFDDSVTYDDFQADIAGELHDLRGLRRGDPLAACLDPGSDVASQQLGDALLQAGSLGIVYPSVRDAGGTCIACFRPALVAHVRRTDTDRFTWAGELAPRITAERPATRAAARASARTRRR